jgi:predicted secreted protein
MKKIAAIIIAFFFFSCNNTQTIKVNDPQPCEVRSGKKFRVNLPEDHRSGYTWQLNEHDKSIVDHFNTVWGGNDKGVYFYFLALKPGTTILNFTSRKYNDVNSIKEITIRVKE